MLKKLIYAALAAQCFAGMASADMGRNFLMQNAAPKHIFVNNRILASVKGKPISVIDVMKKMDMLFYRQFPQYSSSVEARFQFYNVNWKQTLEQLVEKELILADAEDVKMEVSHGDIRQEIENMFGPNIIGNLEKAGLSFEEAWEMVKEEQTLRRMVAMRVNVMAARSVTPLDVKAAYEDFAKSNIKPDGWRYHIISIRGDDRTSCAEVANYAYQLAAKDAMPLDELNHTLEEHTLVINGQAKVNISEEYVRNEKEISESFHAVLASMETGTFSNPVPQESRAGSSTVFRIFYLKEKIPGGAPPFAESEFKLKNRLIDKKIDDESGKYIAKLKKRFHVQTNLDNHTVPDDFNPFVLK